MRNNKAKFITQLGLRRATPCMENDATQQAKYPDIS